MPQTLPTPGSVGNTRTKSVAKIGGINSRDFQQLLKDSVVLLENMWKPGFGRFRKAPGSDLFVTVSTTDDPVNGGRPIKYAVRVNSDLWYLGYGASVSSYVPSTDTLTVVKNDFAGNVSWIQEYGDWVYIASTRSGDKIHYIDHTGAPNTAVEIADAPKADVLTIFSSNRLAAGATNTAESEVSVARVDQLTGVPFSLAADWTTGTDPDAAFKITNKRAGTCVGFGSLSNQTVVLYDEGRLGFRITSVDVSGTGLVLDTPIDWENLDFGSTRGATATSKGIFYANEFGIWQMTSGGLKDIPFSGIDSKISEPLDDGFIDSYDFSDSDLIFDENKKLLLITARDNADLNNKVLVYHTGKDLSGWAVWGKDVSRWIRVGGSIYYTSSRDTTVYLLNYDRGDNNGDPYTTTFLIEPQINGLGTIAAMRWLQLGFSAEKGQEVTATFSLYDRKGIFKDSVKQFTISNSTGYAGEVDGMTSGAMTAIAMSAGSTAYNNLNFRLYSRPIATQDFTRLRAQFQTTDKRLYEINYMNFITEPRGLADIGTT